MGKECFLPFDFSLFRLNTKIHKQLHVKFYVFCPKLRKRRAEDNSTFRQLISAAGNAD